MGQTNYALDINCNRSLVYLEYYLFTGFLLVKMLRYIGGTALHINEMD